MDSMTDQMKPTGTVAKPPVCTDQSLWSRVENTDIYRLLGRIYHDGVIGTKVRIDYRTRSWIRRSGRQSPKRTILFHPDKPNYSQVLYKVCHNLGCAITSSTRAQPDLIVAFEDVTKRTHSALLTEISTRHFVVNQRCDDISKVRVEETFREVFGYGTFVNPFTHQGFCVMKSNDNAMHDGKAVACPILSVKPDVIYQRVINNTVGDEVLDIRVPIVGTRIPFVYLKYRSVARRFSNINARVSVVPVDNVFDDAETTRIYEFARKLGLDYGELDVLRDADDGRIAIVDVNNTPCGPPNHLSRADTKRAIQLLSDAFESEFLATSCDVSKIEGVK